MMMLLSKDFFQPCSQQSQPSTAAIAVGYMIIFTDWLPLIRNGGVLVHKHFLCSSINS